MSLPSKAVALVEDDQPVLFAAPTEKAPAKRKRRSPTEAAHLENGRTSADIIGDWVDMLKNHLGVPPPPRATGRLAKEVRSLIVAQYQESQIKWALAAWTLEFMEDSRVSPVRLEALAWQFAMCQSRSAATWRQHMQAQWRATCGTAGPSGQSTLTPRQKRGQQTATNLEQWAAQRKQEEAARREREGNDFKDQRNEWW